MTESLNRASYLERTFDFKSRPFRNYMAAENIGNDALQQYIDDMRNGEHPVLRFAVGCAYSELAMFDTRRGMVARNIGFRERSLATAVTCWREAADKMTDSTNPRLLYSMAGRLLKGHINQALYSVPRFVAAVMALAHIPVPSAEVEEGNSIAVEHMLKLGSQVREWPAESPDEVRAKDWFMSKVVCGLTVQNPRYTLIPVPVRRIYNPDIGKRRDYNAISLEPPFFKIPLHVVTHKVADADYGEHKIVIDASRDLVVEEGGSPYQAFDALARVIGRNDASPGMEAALESMSASLVSRFDEFVRQRL